MPKSSTSKKIIKPAKKVLPPPKAKLKLKFKPKIKLAPKPPTKVLAKKSTKVVVPAKKGLKSRIVERVVAKVVLPKKKVAPAAIAKVAPKKIKLVSPKVKSKGVSKKVVPLRGKSETENEFALRNRIRTRKSKEAVRKLSNKDIAYIWLSREILKMPYIAADRTSDFDVICRTSLRGKRPEKVVEFITKYAQKAAERFTKLLDKKGMQELYLLSDGMTIEDEVAESKSEQVQQTIAFDKTGADAETDIIAEDEG